MMLPDTVSSHRVIGVLEGQHAMMVDDDLIAWAAQEDNQEYLSIEFCQPKPLDIYSPWQFNTGVAVCIGWCRRYGLVPSAKTIHRHSDTAQGIRNGKSDPGPLFDYGGFIAAVREGVRL